MESTTEDYYAGFEGSDEIIFLMKVNEYTKKTRIWDGYFNTIMRQIEASNDGCWIGLADHYQFHTGWNIERNWQIPDIKEALVQFKNIDLSQNDDPIYKKSSLVLVKIVDFLSEAIEKKLPVYILVE